MSGRLSLFFIGLLLLTSCNNDSELRALGLKNQQLESKQQELTAQLFEKNAEVEKLNEENKRVTQLLKDQTDALQAPDREYERIESLCRNNDLGAALEGLMSFVDKYPCSPQLNEAKRQIPVVTKAIQERKKAENERLRLIREGFNKLKPQSSIKTANTTISIQRIQKSAQWNFDRYDDSYHYREADKDSLYIVADINITSSDSNPELPVIYVGTLSDDGRVGNIEKMNYEFYSWSSYGSYLGNYHDNKNNFAKRKTINFTTGVQVKKNGKKHVVFTNGVECFSRFSGGHRPEISYGGYSCPSIHGSLTIEDFIKGYKFIRLLN